MRLLKEVIYGQGIKGWTAFAGDVLSGFPKLRAGAADQTARKASMLAIAQKEGLPIPKFLQDLYNVETEIVGDVRNIPACGPLLVISNHPDGGRLDAISFLGFLYKLRSNSKIFGGAAFLNAWPMENYLLPTFSNDAIKSQRAVKDGLEQLAQGNCVGLFPEGMFDGELAWTPLPAKLLLSLKERGLSPALLPLYIELPAKKSAFIRAGKHATAIMNNPIIKTALTLKQMTTKNVVRIHIHGVYQLGSDGLSSLNSGTAILPLPADRKAAVQPLLDWMKTTIQERKGLQR